MTSPLFNSNLTSNIDEVDFITVKLLQQSTYNIAYSINTLLYSDGTCTVSLPSQLLGGSFFIDICHRNAVQTMSITAQTISANTIYNFTTAANKAYGNNMTEVEPNVWAFYSGDINHDCLINQSDIDLFVIDDQNGVVGYFCSDIDGNGSVEIPDFPYIDYNSTNNVHCIFPGPVPICPSCEGDSCDGFIADAGMDKTICYGGSTTATVIANGGTIPYSYVWSPGGNNSSTITLSPITTTSYLVYVTDKAGCSATSHLTVYVDSIPAPLTNPSIQCGSNIPDVSVNGPGIFHWYLNPSGGSILPSRNNTTQVNYFINNTTTFYVAAFDGTCESSRVPVVATVAVAPPLTIAASTIHTCVNTIIAINVTSLLGNFDTYLWSM